MATPQEKRAQSRGARQIKQYQFPQDLGTHALLLIFDKYDYGNRRQINSTPSRIPQDSIMLPLPDNLTDPATFRVGATELGLWGALSAGATQLGKEIANSQINSVEDAQRIARQIFGNQGAEDVLKSFGNAAMSSILQGALGAIAPNVQKGLEVGGGYSFNPYQAVAFDGVDLKTFQFDWTLAPSTRSESETIKRIINAIKYHIHPTYKQISGNQQTVASRAFFEYPDVVNTFILGSPSEYMFQFKPAMVSSFSVDYAGSGQHAFLEGGKPAVVKLSMSITEMEVWTKQDYDHTADPLPASF